MRTFLFYVHLVVGLASGLYFCLVGLTGSAIEFAPEFSVWTMPPRALAVESGAPLSMETVIAQIAPMFPDRTVTRLHFSDAMDGRYKITLKSRLGDIDQLAFVDRTTGALLGIEPWWIRWLRELHYYLLNGRAGERLNGWLALVLTIECLIGVVLWWPTAGQWRHAFTINWRGRWQAWNYDAHQVIGAISLALLVVICVTGAYFAFPGEVARVLYASLREVPPPRPSSRPATAVTAIPFESLVRKAEAALPGGVATSLDPALEPTDTIRVRIRMPGDQWDVGRSQVDFDRYSGAMVAVHNAAAFTSRVDRVILLMMPLHYGRFGLAIRFIWMVTGIVPSLLFTSGCLMWWNRSLVKYFRRRPIPAGLPSSAGTSSSDRRNTS